MRHGAALAASTLVALLLPRLVQACAVCTAGRDDENQTAFLISTIFLSLLPLAGIATLVFVLWRRLRRIELDSASARKPAAEPAPLASGLPAGVGTADA